MEADCYHIKPFTRQFLDHKNMILRSRYHKWTIKKIHNSLLSYCELMAYSANKSHSMKLKMISFTPKGVLFRMNIQKHTLHNHIKKKRRCSKVIHDITGIANVSPKMAKLSHSLHSTTTNLKERKKHRFSYDIIRPVYADKKKFTETRCSFLFPCIFMNRVASVFVRSVTL